MLWDYGPTAAIILGRTNFLALRKINDFNSTHRHELTLCTVPLKIQYLLSQLIKIKKINQSKRIFILCSSENVTGLNPVKPQSQHLNLVPKSISRVVMFVCACVFEGVAIKTRRLIFKPLIYTRNKEPLN